MLLYLEHLRVVPVKKHPVDEFTLLCHDYSFFLWISAPSIVRLATWKTTQTEMGDSVPFDPTIPYLRRQQIYGGNEKM